MASTDNMEAHNDQKLRELIMMVESRGETLHPLAVIDDASLICRRAVALNVQRCPVDVPGAGWQLEVAGLKAPADGLRDTSSRVRSARSLLLGSSYAAPQCASLSAQRSHSAAPRL